MPVEIPSNLPEPFPSLAIPGTINPIIMKGTINPKKALKILLKVAIISTTILGTTSPNKTPDTIAITIRGNNPNLFILCPPHMHKCIINNIYTL